MTTDFDEYTFAGLAQLDFDKFTPLVRIVNGVEAKALRDKFIARFIATDKEWYKVHIAQKHNFSDGWYYTGYLWECLKKFELLRIKQVISELEKIDQLVYVLWDLHSAWQERLKNYWKFPKESVLNLQGKELVQGVRYLPEDIYIFDARYDWTLILTHEDNGKDRICYKAFA